MLRPLHNLCISYRSAEAQKCTPKLRVVTYIGEQAKREGLRDKSLRDGTFDVILTTYEVAIRDQSFLSAYKFLAMVVDEGERQPYWSGSPTTDIRQVFINAYVQVTDSRTHRPFCISCWPRSTVLPRASSSPVSWYPRVAYSLTSSHCSITRRRNSRPEQLERVVLSPVLRLPLPLQTQRWIPPLLSMTAIEDIDAKLW